MISIILSLKKIVITVVSLESDLRSFIQFETMEEMVRIKHLLIYTNDYIFLIIDH